MMWEEGRLTGIFLCSMNSLAQGGGAFIEAGAIVRTFTVVAKPTGQFIVLPAALFYIPWR